MEEHSRRPSFALPAGVAAAMEARLEGRGRQDLRARALRLSESYRAGKGTIDAVRNETDALAYALTRMPATYAAAASVFRRLREEQPGLAPRRVLDIGCGPGSASFAASAVWPDIAEIDLLDRSRDLLALARSLAAESGVDALRDAATIEGDFARLPNAPALYDLVVAGYALTEAQDDALPALAEALFARTQGALVVIEPGTPRNHARLQTIRARLIDLGATILAPCPHAAPCPLAAPDWCHFSVRLPRSRAHKLLKDADAPFEDEKYSYVAAARTGAPAPARVIAPARAGKAGATLRLCAANGIRETFTPKRDKARYERIRRKDWGDRLDALPEVAE